MTVHALVMQCFDLIRMQNSQNFLRIHRWTQLERAYSTIPESPAVKLFFSLLSSSKDQDPKKITG